MSEVLLSREGHVATITLNRPDRLNAISGPMLGGLARMLVECDADRDVRVLVLTGAGAPRSFSHTAVRPSSSRIHSAWHSAAQVSWSGDQ